MVNLADGGGGSSSVHTGPRPIPLRPVSDRVPHDWTQYSLEQIWGMIGRQSAATGQITEDMWMSIMTLCRDKASQLEQALARLRVHWPETQESARMFQEWGKSLVAALRCTAETAQLNLRVVMNIKGELEAAKRRVWQLMALRDEYRAQEQQRQPTDLQYFATPDWRPELEREAREVMADLEQKIYTYALDLHADPPYLPTRDIGVGPGVLPLGGVSGPTASWSGGLGSCPHRGRGIHGTRFPMPTLRDQMVTRIRLGRPCPAARPCSAAASHRVALVGSGYPRTGWPARWTVRLAGGWHRVG